MIPVLSVGYVSLACRVCGSTGMVYGPDSIGPWSDAHRRPFIVSAEILDPAGEPVGVWNPEDD